jgi:hypothetical protein
MHAWPRPNPFAFTRGALAGTPLIGGAIVAAGMLGFAATSGSALVLAATLALAAVIATLADWTLGVPILLVISVTDGFLKHLTSSSVTYILKDALLALIVLGLFFRLALHRDERSDATRWRGVIAWSIYVGFMTTQLLHPALSLAGAVGAFRAHAAFAVLFIVGAIYFRRRERLSRTANLTIALLALCAVGALLQHVLGDRWLALSPGFMKASLHYTTFPSEAARAAGADGAVYRMYGTLVDPAALGLASTYGILFAIAGLARLRGIARLLTILAIPLMGTALALSQARAAMAGLAVGIIVLAVLLSTRRATRGFAVAGLFLIVLAVPAGLVLTKGAVADRILAHDQVAYAQQTRDISREIVLNGLASAPFGHGLGATGAGGNLREDAGLGVDNVFFATLYETGIVGLAAFLGVQLTFLALGLRAALRAREVGAQTVFAGAVAAQSAMLVSCWFSQGAFDYAPMAQCFWLFAGAIARSDAWA